MGLSVPDDISIIGFIDTFFMSPPQPRPDHAVHQPVASIVSAAVRNLFGPYRPRNSTPIHEDYVFSPDLVVRGTTRTHTKALISKFALRESLDNHSH